MYDSEIANAANTAKNLAASVRYELENAEFSISIVDETIEFHSGHVPLSVAVLELMADDNIEALKVLKSTINRESRMLENFGAVIETVTLKNGKTRDKVTQKGWALSFRKTDDNVIWTIKAPKTDTESEGDNILVETAKNIANAELTDAQLHQLAVLLADAAATL